MMSKNKQKWVKVKEKIRKVSSTATAQPTALIKDKHRLKYKEKKNKQWTKKGKSYKTHLYRRISWAQTNRDNLIWTLASLKFWNSCVFWDSSGTSARGDVWRSTERQGGACAAEATPSRTHGGVAYCSVRDTEPSWKCNAFDERWCGIKRSN